LIMLWIRNILADGWRMQENIWKDHIFELRRKRWRHEWSSFRPEFVSGFDLTTALSCVYNSDNQSCLQNLWELNPFLMSTPFLSSTFDWLLTTWVKKLYLLIIKFC